MNPKVSIVIPVYNAERTVKKTVESLVYGEEKDIEIILVEDCSKDESWKICQELSNRYSNVYCYQNDKNRGVSYTRNCGLEKVRSEYVLLVDSDDWVSGRYVKELLDAAQNNRESLVICGFHFRDKISGYQQDYLWQREGEMICSVDQKDFFELQAKFHLQQLWNKIFRWDVIEKAHVRFDESQSMGEDFQFVLDYMEAAEIKKCVVLNYPLYYYIRATQTSLMSHFVTSINEKVYNRFGQLLRLCGETTPAIKGHYETAISNLNNNYVYQAVRGKSSKKEILCFIESVMHDGKARQHYRLQKSILIKEDIYRWISEVNTLARRFYGYMQRKKRDKIAKRMRAKLHAKGFTILSQNCIGGVFYHDMGLEFSSPMINLYMTGKDFVSFVLNLDYYLSLKLRMTWGEEYPIGYLADLAIYFMHYSTCQGAETEWEKRKARIIRDNIIVFCTDMEEFTDEVYEKWKEISYPKILFTAKRKYANEPGVVFFPKYENNGKVPDLIPKREFYRDGVLMDTVNQTCQVIR